MKNYLKENHIRIVYAYFSAFALINIGNIATTHIMTLVIFSLCLIALQQIDTILAKHNSSSAKRISTGLGLFFALLYILAEHSSLTDGLTNRLFCFIYLLFTYIGLVVLFYKLLCCLYVLLSKCRIFHTSACIPDTKNRYFWLYAITILICQLPYFLYQYPGVMTPDSLNQYKQIIGILPYSNHHPWLHTMLIQLCVSIGKLFSDHVTIGIAIYTILQMCIMSLIEAFFIITLQKQGLQKKFCILLWGFFALIPYNALFAVTMWKDVLFAGSLLLYTTILYRFCILMKTGKPLAAQPVNLILFVFASISVCLLRSNGWYAFILATPFCFYFFRKYLKTIGALHLIIFAVVLTVKGPILDAYDVAPTEFTEALSIPIQQVARVIAANKELTEDQWASIEKICDATQIAPQYNPSLSDPMKNLLYAHGTEYFDSHKSEYLSLWVELGLKYPLDYLEAYVDQTKGYWFGITPIGLSNEGIIANDVGLTWQPLIHGTVVMKVFELCSKLYTVFPILGLLWSIGGLFWITLIAIGNCIINGRKQHLVLFIPLIAVMLSVMVSTPVADEFRYAYAFILTVPLLLLASFEK